jgi:hypothetical protein
MNALQAAADFGGFDLEAGNIRRKEVEEYFTEENLAGMFNESAETLGGYTLEECIEAICEHFDI